MIVVVEGCEGVMGSYLRQLETVHRKPIRKSEIRICFMVGYLFCCISVNDNSMYQFSNTQTLNTTFPKVLTLWLVLKSED